MPTTRHNLAEIVNERTKERFWTTVDRRGEDECWPWLGYKPNKYGGFLFKDKCYLAHRVAYWLHYKEDPKDKDVCHDCDNPLCCNPHHLWPGTEADNSKDMVNKGRQPRGSGHGRSQLDEQQVRGIIHLLQDTDLTFREIGDIYSVSLWIVASIRSGETWTHITNGKVYRKKELHGQNRAS